MAFGETEAQDVLRRRPSKRTALRSARKPVAVVEALRSAQPVSPGGLAGGPASRGRAGDRQLRARRRRGPRRKWAVPRAGSRVPPTPGHGEATRAPPAAGRRSLGSGDRDPVGLALCWQPGTRTPRAPPRFPRTPKARAAHAVSEAPRPAPLAPIQPGPAQPDPTQPNPTRPNPTQPNPARPGRTCALGTPARHYPRGPRNPRRKRRRRPAEAPSWARPGPSGPPRGRGRTGSGRGTRGGRPGRGARRLPEGSGGWTRRGEGLVAGAGAQRDRVTDEDTGEGDGGGEGPGAAVQNDVRLQVRSLGQLAPRPSAPCATHLQ